MIALNVTKKINIYSKNFIKQKKCINTSIEYQLFDRRNIGMRWSVIFHNYKMKLN